MGNVWILGAGFSRSLGGPLLSTLFSERSKYDILATYSAATYKAIQDDAVYVAWWLYHWGRNFPDGKFFPGQKPNQSDREGEKNIRGMKIWANAEEYIEHLSVAESDTTGRQASLLARAAVDLAPAVEMPSAALLHKAACRYLAAECTLFTEGLHADAERLSPYIQWTNSLTPADTIITFNYDLVPDLLAQFCPGKLHVLLPACEEELEEIRMKVGCAVVLKLHGSVNWQIAKRFDPTKPKQHTVQAISHTKALESFQIDLCMGTPGAMKRDLTSEHLDPLWKHALAAIRSAFKVNFMGYSFPATDAQARSQLLAAMRRGVGQNALKSDVILGLDPTPAERVVSMLLRIGLRSDGIYRKPLLVEDYFTAR